MSAARARCDKGDSGTKLAALGARKVSSMKPPIKARAS